MYGQTKGTELESFVTMAYNAESMGGMMYFALSRIAEQLGLAEVAAELVELGNQEMRHAGFYAILNGRYPADPAGFWNLVRGVSKAEFRGEERVNEFAQKLEEAGFAEAAETVRGFALEERHHGEVTRSLLTRWAPPEREDGSSETRRVYVCPCCGYEHLGEIGSESNDDLCPVCSMPISRFVPKETQRNADFNPRAKRR
ncbi:MAG: hypothetical protein IKE69_02250 [Thermoguttaceae bacterium]|nr:hypothetical protein [Thermoguttaceae bacterium]